MRENMLDRCPVSTYEQVRALSQLAGGWAGGSPAQLSAAQLAGLAFAWVPWAKVAPPLLPPSSSSAPAGAADDYRGPGAAPGGVVPRVCAGPHRQRQPGAGARGDRPRRAPPGGQGAPRPRGAATRPLSSACCCRHCCVDRLLCLPLPCLLLAPSRMLSSVHSGHHPSTPKQPRDCDCCRCSTGGCVRTLPSTWPPLTFWCGQSSWWRQTLITSGWWMSQRRTFL